MRTWRATMLMLLGALGFGGVARAEPESRAAEPACFAPPHSFDGARSIRAARTLGGDPNPSVTLTEPAHLALVPARTLILVAPPGRPVADADRGGLVRLHIGLTGTYRVALGGKAWIDLVQAGKAMPSVAHAHGAPCSGIAKQVDFTLAPGDYTIQLTEAPADAIDLRVSNLSISPSSSSSSPPTPSSPSPPSS